MMYAKHVLRVNVDWSTFCAEGFGAIGPGLLAKRPVHIPYIPISEWFKDDPKLYMDPQAQEKTTQAVEGAEWADGGRGQADDGLPLPEWDHLQGWLPRWQRGCRWMSMPRWRHCASSTTLTFRPIKLELSTSK